MAFPIKQENYLLAPTAEQRKVFVEAWHMQPTDIPATRIDAHFKIRQLLGHDVDNRPTAQQISLRKRQLVEWRAAREQKREARRQALAAIGQPVTR